MDDRRVVVTGLGIVSPLGVGIQDNWQRIVEGKSGIGTIDRFDASGIACTIAGQADEFKVEDYLAPKEARKMDRFIQLGMAAGMDDYVSKPIRGEDLFTVVDKLTSESEAWTDGGEASRLFTQQ